MLMKKDLFKGLNDSLLNEGRWNWQHDSLLINIARMLAKIQGVIVYCDVDGTEFQSPSVITGEIKRPDIVLVILPIPYSSIS